MPKKLQKPNPGTGSPYSNEVHRLDPCIRSECFVKGSGMRIQQGYSFRCTICESSGIVWKPISACPICGEELK